MHLGPRMSRMSSSGAAAGPEAGAGADGDTRAGAPPGEYVGAGARAGAGGEKISGVDGTRRMGAAAGSGAALEAGSDAADTAKDWVPGHTATRPILKAALA